MVDDSADLYCNIFYSLRTLPQYNYQLCKQHSEWYDQSDSLLPKSDNSAGRGTDYQQQLRFFLYG